jgi:hypothetical protein
MNKKKNIDIFKERNGYYPITFLHKDDLKDFMTEEEIKKLTKEDMKFLADEIGDTICETSMFWMGLQIAINQLNEINKKKCI